jgi:hypothetical protein
MRSSPRASVASVTRLSLRSTTLSLISAVGLMSCVSGCLPPIIVPAVEDLSDFEEFTYSLGPALGFCPPDDGILRAELHRLSDDRVMLEMWTFDDAEVFFECVEASEWSEWMDCAVELPPRELTPAEIERMNNLFRSVTVEQVLWFPLCIDPCVISVASWDGRELSDHKSCAGGPYQALSYEQMDEIIAFFDSLRAASAQ